MLALSEWTTLVMRPLMPEATTVAVRTAIRRPSEAGADCLRSRPVR